MDDQSITIREFRMWLAGVEEMQPSNWVPDERQWVIIRNKLETVLDTPIVAHVAPHVVHAPVVPPEPIYREVGPVVHSTPGLSMVTPVAPAHNAALFANADNPTSPVRTPNVDTSTGGYNSAFE
jgi:hypothetical protein